MRVPFVKVQILLVALTDLPDQDGNDPALDWDIFYVGNYTYSNGRGTVTMEQSGKAEGSFTIDGSTMELTFGGQTISMSKLHN